MRVIMAMVPVLCLFLGAAAPAQPPCPNESLMTALAGGNGNAGNMFDITCAIASDVVIELFHVHLGTGTFDMEIYSKPGTSIGFETNASAWTLVGSTTGITGNGIGNVTVCPIPINLEIVAGATRGFYVTVTSGMLTYSNGTLFGAILSQDANILITQGSGNSYPFGALFLPRTFNGTVCYRIGSLVQPPVLVPISDFECQQAGASVPTTPDCDLWQSSSGSQVIMPNSVTQFCASPGTSQWCEVSPNTLGPANPAVTAAIPPTTNFVTGSVSRMQLATTAPTITAGEQLRLRVKWYWLSGETSASTLYNDFAQILVLPQPSGSPVPVVYVDTFSPLLAATNGCTSGVSNLTYASSVGSAQTTVAAMPQSLSGQLVIIDVVAANQGDSSFDSVFWMDEIEWEISSANPLMAPPASTLSLGPGCGSLLLTSTIPVIGSTATITVANAPPSAIDGFLFVGAPAVTPLSLLPGCDVYLNLTPAPAFLSLSFQAGSSTLPVAIPASLDGWQVALQAFEPTLSPLNLSNGLLLTIGY